MYAYFGDFSCQNSQKLPKSHDPFPWQPGLKVTSPNITPRLQHYISGSPHTVHESPHMNGRSSHTVSVP